MASPNTHLITLRKRADISQIALAAELRISVRSLISFEQGQRPLPRARTSADYIDGIEAIRRRSASEKQAAS